ncbi:MAG TPA: ribosome-binding factor A [Acidimicrobiales bacterium]|nr:ribosome-binding factor A [Acidimicrobiales bacterium]
MAGSTDRRRGGDRRQTPYPRVARVNALLMEVVADALEPLIDEDERLGLLTVTGVRTDPDLQHAVVFFSSLTPAAAEALAEHRSALQRTIGRSVRMKRTPLLQFLPDPGVAAGERVEEALRRIERGGP